MTPEWSGESGSRLAPTPIEKLESEPGDALVVLLLGETALLEVATEQAARHRLFALLLAPFPERFVERTGAGRGLITDAAAIGDECGNHVHLFAVLRGRFLDFVWRSQAIGLPLQAPDDSPGENPGQLGCEHLLEVVRNALGLRDRDVERDQVDPAPDCLLLAADHGLVVSREPDLELRVEVEEMAPQETRRDLVAAGQEFDLGLGHA